MFSLNLDIKTIHCVKSVQIRSYLWSVFFCIRTEYLELLRKSPYSVRIQENTDQNELRIWTLFTLCQPISCELQSQWPSLELVEAATQRRS